MSGILNNMLKWATNKVSEEVPEIKRMGEHVQVVLLIIIIDILLIPVYMKSIVAYLLAITLHIYYFGGWKKAITSIVDILVVKLDELENDEFEDSKQNTDEQN